MFYARVKEIVENNDQVNVGFDIIHDEGKEEGVVASYYQAFDASISESDLEAELGKVALVHENEAKQAQLRAEQEKRAENVVNLQKHFLGGQKDETV